jgi:hypothetical protein
MPVGNLRGSTRNVIFLSWFNGANSLPLLTASKQVYFWRGTGASFNFKYCDDKFVKEREVVEERYVTE